MQQVFSDSWYLQCAPSAWQLFSFPFFCLLDLRCISAGWFPSHRFSNTDKITLFALYYFYCQISKMLLLCLYMNDQKLAAFSRRRRHLLSCFPLCSPSSNHLLQTILEEDVEDPVYQVTLRNKPLIMMSAWTYAVKLVRLSLSLI